MSSLPTISQSKLTDVFNRLYEWIGSFWSKVYTDPNFIKHIQVGRSLRVAQLYLGFLENLKLMDRHNAPVFHRERWQPIVIRKSQKDTGSLNVLKFGDNHAVLGGEGWPQDEVYPDGIVFKLGRDTEFRGLEVYPFEGSLDSVHTCIVDNIISPNVILRKGVDFIVDQNSIAIVSDLSPFAENSPFPKFDILDISDDPDHDTDQETVLWACDTLTDEDFVNNYLGYVTGVAVDTTELGKNIVNAYWDMLNYASPECLSVLVATLCGVPYVKTDGEVIQQVQEKAVITDRNVYRFDYTPAYRGKIAVGAVLHRGELLDMAVKILPFVSNVTAINTYLQSVEKETYEVKDVLPVVMVPGSITKSGKGFSADWEPLEPSEFSDKYGIDIEFCTPNSANGKIVPAQYFLENAVGPNTLFISVDTDVIPDAPIYKNKYYRLIREAIPAYIRLVTIGGAKASDVVDISSASDSAFLGASLLASDSYSGMSERITWRFVTTCSNL